MPGVFLSSGGGGGGGAVDSVAGRTGDVVLAKGDVGLGNLVNSLQLVKASNLSDVASTSMSRDNLGVTTLLDAKATKQPGNTVGNLVVWAGGDGDPGDSEINTMDLLLKSGNLSGLASASTARTNLGLGSAATQASTVFDSSGAAATVQGNLDTHTGNTSNPHSVTKTQVGLANVANSLQLVAASNLSDVGNASTSRTNLGLGTGNNVTFNAVITTCTNGETVSSGTYTCAPLTDGNATRIATGGSFTLDAATTGSPAEMFSHLVRITYGGAHTVSFGSGIDTNGYTAVAGVNTKVTYFQLIWNVAKIKWDLLAPFVGA